jgi:hypothetical protein
LHQASYLFQMLLTILAGRGLAPEALDPWRAWVAFKQYVRLVDEAPDPGISVQLTRNRRAGALKLLLLRQAVEPVDNWLEPAGGVVVELTFDDQGMSGPDLEFWSFDYGSFERFVDVVEQTPAIADLLTQAPRSSEVYWEDAA